MNADHHRASPAGPDGNRREDLAAALDHPALEPGTGDGRRRFFERESHFQREVGRDFGVLRVQDSGEGIPESVRARVFEPFFTTKGSGGTGLGLPVVLDIVRSLAGRVSLDNAGERGTVVTVALPRYRPELALGD